MVPPVEFMGNGKDFTPEIGSVSITHIEAINILYFMCVLKLTFHAIVHIYCRKHYITPQICVAFVKMRPVSR